MQSRHQDIAEKDSLPSPHRPICHDSRDDKLQNKKDTFDVTGRRSSKGDDSGQRVAFLPDCHKGSPGHVPTERAPRDKHGSPFIPTEHRERDSSQSHAAALNSPSSDCKKGRPSHKDDTLDLPGAVPVKGLCHIQSSSLSEKDAPETPAPLEAELVTGDMEEQLEEKVRERREEIAEFVIEQLRQTAVTAEVVSNDWKQSCGCQRKRRCFLAFGVLVVAALVTSVLIVVLWQNSETPPTPSPIPTPVKRMEAFRSLLVSLNISGPEIWNDGTPQYRALQWLSEVDVAKLEVNSTSFDIIKERYIVALLYFATNGEGWLWKDKFLSGASICVWHAHDSVSNTGVYCDESNRTETLSFDKNLLAGFVPSEIGLLSNLTHLSFRENALGGTIPTEIGLLRNLEMLSFANNSLVGHIPREIWSLPKLQEFYVWNNILTGSLPTEMGRLRLATYFDFASNGLSATIPSEIGLLTNLVYLNLKENELTGTIPTEIGLLRNLTGLGLFSNDLGGAIPNELWSLTQLRQLSMSENHLAGTLSSRIGALRDLVVLELRGNNITGKIPSEIGNLQQLTGLVASKNMLKGTIPIELGNMQRLQYLFLWKNRLTGTLPSALGQLRSMIMMDFSSNKLNGTVPSVLAALPLLKYLDISRNDFQGDLNPFFCNRTVPLQIWSDCSQKCTCCTKCCYGDLCPA